jgi:hypothetical protein
MPGKTIVMRGKNFVMSRGFCHFEDEPFADRPRRFGAVQATAALKLRMSRPPIAPPRHHVRPIGPSERTSVLTQSNVITEMRHFWGHRCIFVFSLYQSCAVFFALIHPRRRSGSFSAKTLSTAAMISASGARKNSRLLATRLAASLLWTSASTVTQSPTCQVARIPNGSGTPVVFNSAVRSSAVRLVRPTL